MTDTELKELLENINREQRYQREAVLSVAVHAIGAGMLVVLLFLFLMLLTRYCHHAREALF